MAQYLFLDTDLRVLIEQTQRNLFDEVDQLSDTAVLSRTDDEWLAHFIKKFKIDVPEIDTSRAERTYVDGQVPQHPVPNPDFGAAGGVPGRAHTLHIPYSGREALFYFRPRMYSLQSVIAGTSNQEITIFAAGAWHTAQSIDAHFDSAIKFIEENLNKLRADVAPFNNAIEGLVRPRLQARRKSAEQTKATTENMKYPLRKREDAPQTYKLPEKVKALAPAPVAKGDPKAKEEFSLSEADYQEILRICESMSLVMERSPTVFENAEEEHIRVHYLVQLNGQYHGAATGETFNASGKTDILIRYKDKNIFVAECKFWEGYKGLIATVDQLLGYTTWRDTRTALIIFSRRLEFSAVITEALRAMKDHPRYKSGPIKESETRFRYIFRHPNDDQRDIIVTLMLFNMPKPPKA